MQKDATVGCWGISHEAKMDDENDERKIQRRAEKWVSKNKNITQWNKSDFHEKKSENAAVKQNR